MSTLSHAVLHLTPPIAPESPPSGVPSRTPIHVLFGALTELFDILGILHRSLTSAIGLVQTVLGGLPSKSLSYAETTVLRSCRADIEWWGGKWMTAVQSTAENSLPGGKERKFLLDLLAVHYRVASILVEGYLQETVAEDKERYHATARDLLMLVVDTWADSTQFWPMLLLHSSLIAALVLPLDGTLSEGSIGVTDISPDPLPMRAFGLFSPLAHILDATGCTLFHRLEERFSATDPPSTSFELFNPSMATATSLDMYTGSDSFWDGLCGVVGLGGNADENGMGLVSNDFGGSSWSPAGIEWSA